MKSHLTFYVFVLLATIGVGHDVLAGTATPIVDERLFLLRTLQNLYDRMPTDLNDPAQFASAAKDLRQRAVRLQQYSADHELGLGLTNAYADYVASLDEYVDYLTDIGRIKSSESEQASKDNRDSGWDAVSSGHQTYKSQVDKGADDGDAKTAGVAVGVFKLLADEYEKSQARDQATREAMAAASKKIADRITLATARCQNVSAEMTRQYGWAAGEAGFDPDGAPDERQVLANLSNRGDWKVFESEADQLVAALPRDPWVRMHRAEFAESDPTRSANDLMQLAKDSANAGLLVPPDVVYDDVRLDCIAVAAMVASNARLRELDAGISPYGSTDIGDFAVKTWKQAVGLAGKDSAGTYRENYAWSLLSDNQTDESLKIANQLSDFRKDNAWFNYKYACLCSRIGDYDHALGWLGNSIGDGFADFSGLKLDSDLQALRLTRPKQLADLMEVKWRWRYVPGIFNDDITVTNTSNFILTNVTIEVTLTANDKNYSATLTANSISPGETHNFSNCVSVPGSQPSNSAATLTCEQNRL